MRVYSRDAEEALRARHLLADWKGEALLSAEQYAHLEKETVTDLRTTNSFLRIVLFLFTALGVAAAVALFFAMFLEHAEEQTIGIFCLIFAPVCYAAAEAAAARTRLYRHGIEEALAAGSVALLCFGMEAAFFNHSFGWHPEQSIVPAAGAALSLWIWRRFGLWYFFLVALIFVAFLPACWTVSPARNHATIALLYAAGIFSLNALRPRDRSALVEPEYSLAEALLWLGIYLALNLKLAGLDPRTELWAAGDAASQFSKPFYWTTWVLIWALPAITLVRGIRRKDRPVLAAGLVTAVLTLVTNKPYLGWPRHTWDPMLLGIMLIAVALYVRRWLSPAPNGIRAGFTAARLSGKDKQWITIASPALGLITPQDITPAAQSTSASPFRGGASGGGGASGNF